MAALALVMWFKILPSGSPVTLTLVDMHDSYTSWAKYLQEIPRLLSTVNFRFARYSATSPVSPILATRLY